MLSSIFCLVKTESHFQSFGFSSVQINADYCQYFENSAESRLPGHILSAKVSFGTIYVPEYFNNHQHKDKQKGMEEGAKLEEEEGRRKEGKPEDNGMLLVEFFEIHKNVAILLSFEFLIQTQEIIS